MMEGLICAKGLQRLPTLATRTWGGVLQEEAKHLPRSVRPPRIGVGTSSAASRPSVSGPMDLPMFKDCPAAHVGMDSASIGMSSCTRPQCTFSCKFVAPLDRAMT
jgi:hypothetical protein